MKRLWHRLLCLSGQHKMVKVPPFAGTLQHPLTGEYFQVYGSTCLRCIEDIPTEVLPAEWREVIALYRGEETEI